MIQFWVLNFEGYQPAEAFGSLLRQLTSELLSLSSLIRYLMSLTTLSSLSSRGQLVISPSKTWYENKS